MDHTILLLDMDGYGYQERILVDMDRYGFTLIFVDGYGWIWITQTLSMSISTVYPITLKDIILLPQK